MLIIDRFEGNFAAVETDNGMVRLPLHDLPDGAKEGDVLKLSVDKTETSGRKKKIKSMMQRLFVD